MKPMLGDMLAEASLAAWALGECGAWARRRTTLQPQSPAQCPPCCVTLGKQQPLSELPFSHLANRKKLKEHLRGWGTLGHPAEMTDFSLWGWAWLPICPAHPLLVLGTAPNTNRYSIKGRALSPVPACSRKVVGLAQHWVCVPMRVH